MQLPAAVLSARLQISAAADASLSDFCELKKRRSTGVLRLMLKIMKTHKVTFVQRHNLTISLLQLLVTALTSELQSRLCEALAQIIK